MVVSKAACAQRARRRKEKPTQPSKQKPQKATQSNAKTNFPNNIDHMLLDAWPGSISIDGESNQCINISNNEEQISNQKSDCSLFESYNQDLALINESQQLECCRDGDKSNDDKAVAKILWPMSFSNQIYVQRKKLKSGGSKMYLMPTKNPSDSGVKLVPWKLPQTTKHAYKMNAISAVEKNNGCLPAKKDEQARFKEEYNDLNNAIVVLNHDKNKGARMILKSSTWRLNLKSFRNSTTSSMKTICLESPSQLFLLLLQRKPLQIFDFNLEPKKNLHAELFPTHKAKSGKLK
ncbi:hypothetical protein VP01_1041g3 [Puccinia sorghi]|uniref:Uncharacterized protein n=1 Tax=Puccinia sorghi TaxID=27349 RepID=A0A0L6VUC0_9BASI|nr:hypothetical protein VP01_1041g3 [Puccinia sorghi]